MVKFIKFMLIIFKKRELVDATTKATLMKTKADITNLVQFMISNNENYEDPIDIDTAKIMLEAIQVIIKNEIYEIEKDKEINIECPTRCKIIYVTGIEVLPRIKGKIPVTGRFHIGKEGLAERMKDGKVRITLDDGNILWGYECWWIPK